jgi:hypothetical protein
MALSPIDFLNGLFSLIFVTVTIIVGLKIALRYFEIKNRVFLLIGLGWAGLCSAWYPSSISFLCVLITGKGLDPVMYFFIGNVIIHLAATLYILGITDMIYKEKQKIIIGVWAIFGLIYNIYFYWALLTDPSIIGTLEGYLDVTYVRFVSIYLFILIITLFLFTILLGRQSLKSEQPDIKLKGKLILIAITLYVIGAILDATITLTAITLIITRIILISASILFYLAYVMPEFLKRRVTKES